MGHVRGALKLLRAIQELAVERVGGHATRAVDIRVVVATNQRLRGLVSDGRFRADLYYRLAGVELTVPPLRRRREDIVELAEYFLARHQGLRRLALSDSAAEALLTYDWPGNVRELQRVVERALALTTADVVGLGDLPAELTREYADVLQPSVARAESMRAWGSRYARLVLERCGRNKAARLRGAWHQLSHPPVLSAVPPSGSQTPGSGSNGGSAASTLEGSWPVTFDSGGCR